MTRPRKALISLADTPYYHITSRCVRRAFLCGEDEYSGRNYEHRRQWIVDRIRLLSSIFAIDICAYAVMSNHYHLVLKISPDQLDSLDDDQIIERWCALFKGPRLIQQFRDGEPLSAAECSSVSDVVKVWRGKLASISWFMRCLNQTIARQANLEDRCTGKFWECRFSSQALKTEEALLSCMTYVDLNPVRAEIAVSPETSDFTSVQERIEPAFDLNAALKNQRESGDLFDFRTPLKPLLHFDEAISSASGNGIPFNYRDYLDLLDWTGRIVRPDRLGYIDEKVPPLFERLSITAAQWRINTTQFEAIHASRFNRAVPDLDTG